MVLFGKKSALGALTLGVERVRLFTILMVELHFSFVFRVSAVGLVLGVGMGTRTRIQSLMSEGSDMRAINSMCNGCAKSMKLLFGALVILLLSMPAFSQGNLGRIMGTVTDQSGGVVAGATVT